MVGGPHWLAVCTWKQRTAWCASWGRRRERRLTLLPTTELLDLLLLIHLGVERHLDAHSGVVFDAAAVLFVRVFGISPALVSFPLDDQASTPSRNQPLEYFREFFRDLLEGPLDCLVFALIKMRNQLLDGCLRCVKFFAPLQQLLLLCGEAVVLLKRFLVDMLVLLELLVGVLQPLRDLIREG